MRKAFMLAFLAASMVAPAASAALMTGDLAFVGFNADGDDGWAVVALTNIAAGEEVYFRDDEWDDSDGFGGGEGELLWTTPAISAGTVFFFDDVAGPSPGVTASGGAAAGTITDTPLDGANGGPGDFGISGSGEDIFAFQGASNSPVTFIAAFSSEESVMDTLAGTGLTAGTTAVAMTGVSGAPDVAQYTGPRSGLGAFADYLPLIGNPANWTVLGDGGGDQSVPLSTEAFTIVPEPGTFALLLMGFVGVSATRRR